MAAHTLCITLWQLLATRSKQITGVFWALFLRHEARGTDERYLTFIQARLYQYRARSQHWSVPPVG
jgi:hypothetical protein